MTDPVAFEIFGRPIFWYGVFFACGFLAAVLHWTLLAKRSAARGGYPAHSRPAEMASDLALWMMIGGVAGARLAYVTANWDAFAAAPLTVFRIDQGGLIFYGGMLGAIAAAVFYARIKKEPVWTLGDFIITAAPLGHAFGRFGCFLNGCCYGRPAIGDGFFTIRYPRFDPPTGPYLAHPDGLFSKPLYATQMFEVVTNLCIFALLLYFYRRKRVHGRVVALYLLVYPVTRFVNEFFRGDERMLGGGINAAQYLSMGLFIAGVALWFLAPRFPENRNEPVAD